MTMSRRILVGTVLWLSGLAILLSLGLWQVQRAAWKQTLIMHRQQAAALPPAPLEAVLDDNQHPLTDRQTFASLDLLPIPPVRLTRINAGKPGYILIRPARITSGAYQGYHLAILSGWLPLNTPPPPPQALAARLYHGRIAVADRRTWLSPDNDPAQDFWLTFWPEQLASFWHSKPALPVGLALDPPEPGLGHLPSPPPLPDNHHQYAATWFALAAAWAIIGVVAWRRQTG